MKILKLLIIGMLVSSCFKRERSGVEWLHYDEELVHNIISKYDSSFVDSTKLKDDFWTIEHYLTGTAIDKKIFRDSSGNILGIVIQENGEMKFSQEYYDNGQAKGKFSLKSGLIAGPTKYYYRDGRIRSEGLMANSKEVGKWKQYSENGYLESIKYYDKDGHLVKVRQIN